MTAAPGRAMTLAAAWSFTRWNTVYACPGNTDP